MANSEYSIDPDNPNPCLITQTVFRYPSEFEYQGSKSTLHVSHEYRVISG